MNNDYPKNTMGKLRGFKSIEDALSARLDSIFHSENKNLNKSENLGKNWDSKSLQTS